VGAALAPAVLWNVRVGDLRVMTWNVHGLRRRGEVVAAVTAEGPDVLAITEPPRGPAGPARLRGFAAACGMRVASRVRTCAVLVRADLPVHRTRAVRLPWTPGLTRRGVAVAHVAGVRVHAVHLGLRAAERAHHLTRLQVVLAATPGPVVVAGDLNERPGGPSWRALGVHLHDLAPAAGPTYPADAPTARIDAVLGSGVTAGPARVPAATGSDHLPVVVTVSTR
jgi:endonuclease/exonuclease/phosphatase family metal-dependent hydrolase